MELLIFVIVLVWRKKIKNDSPTNTWNMPLLKIISFYSSSFSFKFRC